MSQHSISSFLLYRHCSVRNDPIGVRAIGLEIIVDEKMSCIATVSVTGSKIRMDKGGKCFMPTIKTLFFRSLVLTLVLTGFNVYAADQSICQSGVNIVFYDNGSLKSCQLNDNYDANQIQCKGDSNASFYDNGNLQSCVLSTSVTIGNNKCKEDNEISFYRDGNLESCVNQD
jgi:hypothetical protein